MEKWVVNAKRADFNKIADTFHISPVLARLMRNRDLITEDEMRMYLYGDLTDLPSPYLLKDVEKAADIMCRKIKEDRKIRIISDYDVDGVSSNYILYVGLKKCGAMVDYCIPHRIEDGYGINENLITEASKDGIDTIITCDNGISALNQIRYANELGITVIVTDHHDIPYEETEQGIVYHIPEAAAVVNPKQKDCPYPYKSICGAVVCYKFMQVMFEKCGISSREMEHFLPIAALATECDVMPLKHENRIIVKEGIKRMSHSGIPGLHALLEANNYLHRTITSYTLGFIIGPCINASGRLKSAQDAMELLLCQDPAVAKEKAEELVSLNAERKEMTNQGTEEAIRYLEETGHVHDKVLIVYLPEVHESIAGIIAGRIKELYNKPTFVLTKGKEGVKGSGRSIEAYHMHKEMTRISDCFTKFGGHPMAAGLSLEESRIEEMRERLNHNTTLQEEDFIKKILIDIPVPFGYLTESFVDELSLLEPFGMDNKKPVFAQKNLQISSLRLVGKTKKYVKLYLRDETGFQMEAMYFGDAEAFCKEIIEKYGEDVLNRLYRGLATQVRIHIIYYPEINEWNGTRSINIKMENYQFA